LSTGKIDADAITLTSVGTGVTASASGLEVQSNGLGLLQGCGDGEVLKWIEASGLWDCAADATGSGGSTTKYLVNQHDNNTTTGTEVTELSTTLTAGTYIFEYSLIVQSSATTTGLTFGINYTGTATSFVMRGYWTGTGASASTGILQGDTNGAGAEAIIEGGAERTESTTAPNLTVMTGVGTVNVDNLVTITGVMVVSDGGDIELWHGSETAATTRIMAGSSVIITQITAGADLAEIYGTMDETMMPGDVVSLDPNLRAGVKKSEKTYDKNVFGIISTSPGIVTGSLNDSEAVPVLVALAGRVPVKVTTENGPIKPGDLLTSSSTPGVAMKATKAGQIIGQAMMGFEGEGIGQVLAFIKTDYANGSSLADIVLNLTDSGNLPMEIGKAALKQFIDQKEETLQSNNISEIITDRLAAGLEIIAPKVLTQDLAVESIRAMDKNISLELDGEGKFLVKNETGETGITFDGSGNADFSGTITANKIKANQIEGLEIFETGIRNAQDSADSSATQVKSLSQQIADLQRTFNALNEKSDGLEIASIKNSESDGGLAVGGPVEFKGPAIFKAIAEFMDKVIFRNKVEFRGQVTFNQDTAGYAIVTEGTDRVAVTFAQEYAHLPVVNTSLSLQQIADPEIRKAAEDLLLVSDVKMIITNVTTTGFEIRINQTALSDIPFSWQAIAVADARTFESLSAEALEEAASLADSVPTPGGTAPAGPAAGINAKTANPILSPEAEPAIILPDAADGQISVAN